MSLRPAIAAVLLGTSLVISGCAGNQEGATPALPSTPATPGIASPTSSPEGIDSAEISSPEARPEATASDAGESVLDFHLCDQLFTSTVLRAFPSDDFTYMEQSYFGMVDTLNAGPTANMSCLWQSPMFPTEITIATTRCAEESNGCFRDMSDLIPIPGAASDSYYVPSVYDSSESWMYVVPIREGLRVDITLPDDLPCGVSDCAPAFVDGIAQAIQNSPIASI